MATGHMSASAANSVGTANSAWLAGFAGVGQPGAGEIDDSGMEKPSAMRQRKMEPGGSRRSSVWLYELPASQPSTRVLRVGA